MGSRADGGKGEGMKSLPNIFYCTPDKAQILVDRKDLKELLLSTEGVAIIKGSLYDIIGKPMVAGVYKVTVKERGKK